MITSGRKLGVFKKVSIVLAVTFALVLQPIGVVLQSQPAQAAPWGWYQGYFYGGSFTSTRFNVINDGLPTWVDTKSELINYVLGKFSGAPLDIPGNYASMDATGAAYIIQTMRGGTDHGIPSGSDITDWMARINNPDIYLQWSWYRADINSARMNYSSPHRDASAYNGDGVSYYSLLLRSSSRGGQVMYALKQLCANPLGGLSLPDPINFSLNPTISVSPDSSEGGSQATLTPSVNNSGATGSSNVQWRVTTFRVPPGSSVPGGPTNNGTDPVTHYGNNASTAASGTRTFARGNNAIAVAAQTIGDYPVGYRVCYALSVQPRTQSSSQWRHSAPDCVIISKKPKVQILGNDLIVGKQSTSAVVTATTRKSVSGTNRTYGSWGEYAVIASGQVTGMASGAGYSGGATSTNYCLASLLTLSNATAANQTTHASSCSGATDKGLYAVNRPLPDISSRLTPTDTATGSINLVNAPERVYLATGSLDIVGGTIPRGKWIVINAPTATVTITDDIRYTSNTLQSLADIPQVVIIANQILIESDVRQVDAWLIASGTTGAINTCKGIANPADAGDPLTSSRCSNDLIVNGPVAARHLYLYRTAGAGAGAATGTPAEIFNLRPDAYLWATYYNSSAGRLPTVSTQELPPRF